MYFLEVYIAINGKRPFNDWLQELDFSIKQKMRSNLEKLRIGNFGNCRSVGDGVLDAKIDFGPGYRIYFSLVTSTKILILFAGTKRTQTKDIEKAKKCLKEYKI